MTTVHEPVCPLTKSLYCFFQNKLLHNFLENCKTLQVFQNLHPCTLT